ncbi:hypothetical protein E4U58_002147 [Claviceps cyperi]|nr:hypothetical protein E4U58_002147 [Claviceps cyperi]
MAHAASPEKEIERNYALGLVCVEKPDASARDGSPPYLARSDCPFPVISTPKVRTHTPTPDHQNITNKIADFVLPILITSALVSRSAAVRAASDAAYPPLLICQRTPVMPRQLIGRIGLPTGKMTGYSHVDGASGTMKRQCLRKVPGFGLQLASDIH